MPSYLLLSSSFMHYLESPALPLFPPICPCTQPQALPSPAALPRVTQPSAQHAHCASCAAFAPPFSLPFPCPFHYTRFGANSSLRTLRAHRKSRACLSMPPHEREGLTHPAPSASLARSPPTRHTTFSTARPLCLVRCFRSAVFLTLSLPFSLHTFRCEFFPAHPSRSPKKQGLLIDASP